MIDIVIFKEKILNDFVEILSENIPIQSLLVNG